MFELVAQVFLTIATILGGIVSVIEFGKYFLKFLRRLTNNENPDPNTPNRQPKAPKVPWLSGRIPFTKIRISIGKDGTKSWIGAEGADGSVLGMVQYECRAAMAYLAGGVRAWVGIFAICKSFFGSPDTKYEAALMAAQRVSGTAEYDRTLRRNFMVAIISEKNNHTHEIIMAEIKRQMARHVLSCNPRYKVSKRGQIIIPILSSSLVTEGRVKSEYGSEYQSFSVVRSAPPINVTGIFASFENFLPKPQVAAPFGRWAVPLMSGHAFMSRPTWGFPGRGVCLRSGPMTRAIATQERFALNSALWSGKRGEYGRVNVQTDAWDKSINLRFTAPVEVTAPVFIESAVERETRQPLQRMGLVNPVVLRLSTIRPAQNLHALMRNMAVFFRSRRQLIA